MRAIDLHQRYMTALHLPLAQFRGNLPQRVVRQFVCFRDAGAVFVEHIRPAQARQGLNCENLPHRIRELHEPGDLSAARVDGPYAAAALFLWNPVKIDAIRGACLELRPAVAQSRMI